MSKSDVYNMYGLGFSRVVLNFTTISKNANLEKSNGDRICETGTVRISACLLYLSVERRRKILIAFKNLRFSLGYRFESRRSPFSSLPERFSLNNSFRSK